MYVIVQLLLLNDGKQIVISINAIPRPDIILRYAFLNEK